MNLTKEIATKELINAIDTAITVCADSIDAKPMKLAGVLFLSVRTGTPGLGVCLENNEPFYMSMAMLRHLVWDSSYWMDLDRRYHISEEEMDTVLSYWKKQCEDHMGKQISMLTNALNALLEAKNIRSLYCATVSGEMEAV